MKKALSLFATLFVWLCCHAQVFLNNPDYIYGIGVAETESAADSTAMLSLSRAIYTDVTNYSHHEYEESGGKFTETYRNSVSLDTRIRISGAKKWLDVLANGKYRVYYYINTREYIDSRVAKYNEWLGIADSYRNHKEPHAVNYALGSLFCAYIIMDDELLNAIYPESKSNMRNVFEEIQRINRHNEFILSKRTDERRPNWARIRNEKNYPLPGFEYVNLEGKWVSPAYFLDEDLNSCSDRGSIRWADIDTRGRLYRLTYEIKVDGRDVKLDVPDRFYYQRNFIL